MLFFLPSLLLFCGLATPNFGQSPHPPAPNWDLCSQSSPSPYQNYAWARLTDPIDGQTYGYSVVTRDQTNYYQAEAICKLYGSEVVSIHSAYENSFVLSLAAAQLQQCQSNSAVCATRMQAGTSTPLPPAIQALYRSFWIGMHRIQFFPFGVDTPYTNPPYCVWSDGTACIYGSYNGTTSKTVVGPGAPWGNNEPSGSNTWGQPDPIYGSVGVAEECTEMWDSNQGKWNDIACDSKLGGFICKKACNPSSTFTCSSDPNWPYAQTQTFDGGRTYNAYIVIPLQRAGTYWQVRALCQQRGGNVVSIHSAAENQYVANLISLSGLVTSQSAGVWIGIHRFWPQNTQITPTCNWEDGTQCESGFTVRNAQNENDYVQYPWATGQPSGTKSYGSCIPASIANGLCQEDCAQMFNGANAAGQWNDISCNSNSGVGVVCKKPCTFPYPTQAYQHG